jgi:hypothetical protein
MHEFGDDDRDGEIFHEIIVKHNKWQLIDGG